MEQKIKEVFDRIEMPSTCQDKITKNFQRRIIIRPWIRCIAIASVIVLFIAVLLQNPNVVQALEKTFGIIVDNINVLDHTQNENGAYIITPEHFGITQNTSVELETTFSETSSPSNENLHSREYLVENIPPWLDPADDGLYFIADGQRIEIGSKITEDIPFTYVFTTYDNLIFYIVIGGTYEKGDPNLADVGWAFWYQDGAVAKANPGLAWIGGNSRGAFTEGVGRPWYQTGKRTLGVPFP